MVALTVTSLLLSAGALVFAAPASLDGRADCSFTDAATAIKNKGSCTNIILDNIKVPAGMTLDLTGLKSGTTVTFNGTTTFGYKEWEGPLISISGTAVKVTGMTGHLIDGGGEKYWDGKGSNGGKTKPKFFAAHSLNSSSITGLNVKNTPVQAFSINQASTLTVDRVTIDNSAGDTGGGHNTDAFDIGSSTNVVISNANVKNQDDCVAINSGTNIQIIGCKCDGGHGVSIGSVGGRKDNTVKNALVSNTRIINSDNGIRVKTISGATGNVSGITYKNVTLKNIAKYGIVIQQDYLNGGPTGKPTTGVPITDLTISNVSGSVAESATSVYILCGKGSCADWQFSNLKLGGGKKSSSCANVPAGASC